MSSIAFRCPLGQWDSRYLRTVIRCSLGHWDSLWSCSDIPTCTMGVLNVHPNCRTLTCTLLSILCLFVPWDTRTEVGCTSVPQVLLSIPPICTMGHKDRSGMCTTDTVVYSVCPSTCTTDTIVYSWPPHLFVPWDTRTEVGFASVPHILLCIPVHSTYSYHGEKGQKWDVLVYHRYCCVLLSVPSTCTTRHKDRSGMY